MAYNIDGFETTYRKIPGVTLIGKNPDTDKYNTIYVDENGHLYVKLLGCNNDAAVELDCDANGKLNVVVADYDPTAKYKITDIDPTDGNSYYGYTDKDGGWYIKHLTATEVRYVKGDSGYAAAWGLRDDSGTVYDYFYEVFS